MNGYEKYCELVDEIGYEETAESFARAICDDELSEICDFIARMFDIEFEEED